MPWTYNTCMQNVNDLTNLNNIIIRNLGDKLQHIRKYMYIHQSFKRVSILLYYIYIRRI